MKKRICKMLTLVMTGSMVLGVTSPVYAEKKDDVTKISFAIWDEFRSRYLMRLLRNLKQRILILM